jgi:hypothetical protein
MRKVKGYIRRFLDGFIETGERLICIFFSRDDLFESGNPFNRILFNRISMKTRFLIVIAPIVVCFSSCKNKVKDDAIKIVAEWKSKEIKFPEGIPCFSMGKDTTCMDLYNDNCKIMLYVDSLGCTNCRLKLSEWKKIMQDADTVFTRKPEFIFFFQPKKKDEKELAFLFRQNGFRHPVFVDRENEIGKLNGFPSNFKYQCFLLDKNNRVIIVGNPTINSGIWTLFKKIITEKEYNKTITGKKGKEPSASVRKMKLSVPASPKKKGGAWQRYGSNLKSKWVLATERNSQRNKTIKTN